jgi:hypothetical protein
MAGWSALRWAEFSYQDKTYDLSHLHPKTVSYIRPAKGKDPARTYAVDVIFSFHCFTHECKDDEEPDPALLLTHGSETRVFDFARWELSNQLPGIISGLMERKCFHAGRSNYLTVELMNNSRVANYSVFFEVSRASRKGALNLYVQSAHVREIQGQKQRHNPPIAFAFILHNTLNKIAIKAPI